MGASLPVGNSLMLLTKPDFEFGTMRIMLGLIVRNSDASSPEKLLNYLERIFEKYEEENTYWFLFLLM
jgi:hypothetical protein